MTAPHLEDIYLDKLTRMTQQELQELLSGNPKEALVWVRIAAFKGIAEAQIRLGRMLLEDKNPEEAFTWFQRAATTNNADAINMLGRCYENGWGTAVNPQQAYENYQRAALLGHDWAQYNLGHCYLNGNGTERNHQQAVYWYGKAVAQDHPRAMNLLARCYELGWGVERNQETARHWYQKSAERGYFRGQFNWASMLVDTGQMAEAANWYLLAAKHGTQNVRRAVASVLTASQYRQLKAYSLIALEYCCENGDAEDFYRYGQALQQGLTDHPDPEKAAYWLKRARETRQ